MEADPHTWTEISPEPMEEADPWHRWDEVDARRSHSRGTRLLAGVLIVAAVAWVAAFGWSVALAPPAPLLGEILPLIVSLCVPLALLGLVWLLFGQTPRRETERFTRAVAAMRSESQALEALLANVASRLEDNHSRLTDETAKLMSLGDEASDRLGRVTYYLSKEGAKLGARAEALEAAADAARVDFGVLLADLPRAEEQARSLSEALRTTGLAAHEQAGSLEGQLSALIARGREADEVVGGAAQRLAAHLGRIETNSAAAASRMDEAAASMTAAIDDTMARAAEAVDGARQGIDQQGSAMLALLDQNKAAFDQVGDEAVRALSRNVHDINESVARLAAQLEAQDAASRALVDRLRDELGEVDERFASLSEAGSTSTSLLAASLVAVREEVQQLGGDLDGGGARADELIERSRTLSQQLSEITAQLGETLPGALSEVEDRAERTREAAATLAPSIEAIRISAETAGQQVNETEASIARQQQSMERLLLRIMDGVGAAETKLRSLGESASETDGAFGRLVHETGPELVEALVRVREAANQAADRAREAISAVIPESAQALGAEARKVVGEALADEVNGQMGALGENAEQAVAAARQASERLTRQMLMLGETTAAIEARIEEAEHAFHEREQENFSRRVGLLIESLNSTAIDVTKILSNDVTDSAWAAYLKGDRGVFTRRAVRLLDTTEAREIVRHYEAEPEFRDQVNRYIHDFEAMLRRILVDRDGHSIGVTLLSSDMGKLYVALAQSIERLRK